jgi:ubiquinone/menaquinone biosynthesis C-methylase UbiE
MVQRSTKATVIFVLVVLTAVIFAILQSVNDSTSSEWDTQRQLQSEIVVREEAAFPLSDSDQPINTTSEFDLRKVNPERWMDPPSSFEFKCPPFRFPSSKSADGKSIHETVSKYSRYVNQYCNRTGLLQMNVNFRTYSGILDTVARIARIKHNARILDWGCGCGTMLNYFHMKFNTTGIGLDITESAVRHARAHSQPRQLFCYMDGSNLRMFPAESFDAIVSWATLYHIRRTLVQCDVVHQFVRILKPGSVAYVGHLRTEKTQEYWKKNKCRPDNATIVRYRDYKTYNQPSWKRNQFFSVVVVKHKSGVTVETPTEDG